MKLTFKYVFVFSIIVGSNQQTVFSQELKIGQQVPYCNIANVFNHKTNQINLKDYRGKLVILDFWGFYCTACLKTFAKIDSIQKQYNNQIQIILVNKDEKEKTKEFFLKRKRLKIPDNIPLITNDSLLNNIFPHQGVPFYVWIDSSGRICYQTDEYVTSANVSEYLNGKTSLFSKTSAQNYLSSLFDKDLESYIKYSTYISRGIDSVNIHIDYMNDNIPYDCHSIQDLYQFAYNKSDNDAFYKFREPGRTILEVQDPMKYKYIAGTNYDEWRGKYGYYYHAMLPERIKKNKYKIMQEDLCRYFGLNVKIENRKVKCLELIRTSTKDKLKSKGGQPYETNFLIDLRSKDNDPESSPVRFIRNKPFHGLVDVIRGYGYWQFYMKVVDSTGYSGKIDFEIKENNLQNVTVASLRKELSRYDLDLVEKYIPMDVLIISEKK